MRCMRLRMQVRLLNRLRAGTIATSSKQGKAKTVLNHMGGRVSQKGTPPFSFVLKGNAIAMSDATYFNIISR